MSPSEPIRIFIGTGQASLVEARTLAHSLRKHTTRRLEIFLMNGTRNSIETLDGKALPSPLTPAMLAWNVTEFSLYRFAIPQLCGHRGKAVYLDSDMICLRDIGELYDTDLAGCDFLAKRDAYGPGVWGLSVMLIDCDRCRFDLTAITAELESGAYSYDAFSCMKPEFLARRPYRIGSLDPAWNSFDSADASTLLIHYTNLSTQPWKFPGHPHASLWFRYFEEAVQAGYLTRAEVEAAIARNHVRWDLLRGNASGPTRALFFLEKVNRGLRHRLSAVPGLKFLKPKSPPIPGTKP